ncbi:mitochondrial import inner membrane translocase subunit TIM23-2-like [Oryza brachyantha]|uniref:mitochondrial import inner membrane translocase subunit TIM23-2-like n=1 Tax=Oryza brachyantha TaxID=4533 RepID=UPI001AD96596|nr:mitochondrial import inner membrane translocase subunit TIM23-2-like [Oryza brachyantha]
MADPRLFSSGSDPSGDRYGASSAPSRRKYNPYQDLNTPYSYQTLYDLPTSPEFLFQEESAAQRRSWGENLTYYTGVGYLSGAVGGAALGLRDAAAGAEPGETAKIRANRVLNSCGSSGRRAGNRLGVIGLMYAGMESALVAARDRDDWINSVAAGLGTGALFRAANGPRSAAVAGAIGGVLAGAAMAGKQLAKRYVPAI